MGFLFSPSKMAFFHDALFPASALPVDVVRVGDDLHESLMDAQSLGASIAIGGDGLPYAHFSTVDLQHQRLLLISAVNDSYRHAMAAIADGYPLHERESWPVQLEEANALQADPEAVTPWLDACAAARGLDKAELARRVLEKDAAYRVISGNLSGIRQRHEDAIAQLETVEQAQAYDVHAWWPE